MVVNDGTSNAVSAATAPPGASISSVLGANEIRPPATSPGCRHHGALLDRGLGASRATIAVHRRPAQDGEDHLVTMLLFKVEIACINAILGGRAFGGVPPIMHLVT